MAQLILALETPRAQVFAFNPINGKKQPVDCSMDKADQLTVYSALEKDYTKASDAVQGAIKAAFLEEVLTLKTLGKFVNPKVPYISPKGINVALMDKERTIVSTCTVEIPD